MVKTYVVDTNILMSTEGRVLYGFSDNEVIVTHTTLEELDNNKTRPGEIGYQARESIRKIDEIVVNKAKDENVLKGIKLNNGGTFRLVTNFLQAQLPVGWSLDRPDNRILCTTKTLQNNAKSKVILITNDVNMKIKAEALDIDVQSYQNDQISSEVEYTGRRVIELNDKYINAIYDKGSLKLKEIKAPNIKSILDSIYEHEFVMLKGNGSGGTALTWKKLDELRLIKDDKKQVFGIRPKNTGQRYALAALMAPVNEIPLVILKGAAGTGKTLLSMAVGLDKTYDEKKSSSYEKIVITRSNTLSDEDLGFLPGDLEDKMSPLLAPFFDNLEYLIGKGEEDMVQVKTHLQDIIGQGIIEITSLSYIRGRSLRNTYLVVDEAQNLTRLQAKTIVTRMGIGSKLVVLGDPNQIDNPKLDKKNNGLVYLSEKFKDSKLCAQVEFTNNESVRSDLAIDAIERL